MKHEENLTGKRLVTGGPQQEDLHPGVEIRPRHLADYIGQEQVKQSLRVFIQAALQRGEPLDHVLFHGFPGSIGGIGFGRCERRALADAGRFQDLVD